jgi:beta-lactamase regulating signal transducer with metallopeptidase domain
MSIAIAWTLLHFLWQGAAIAALAAGLRVACRTPAARYLVGMGALAAMVLSFAITFSVVSYGAAGEDAIAATPATTVAGPVAEYPAVAATAPAAAADTHHDEMLWIARGWVMGVGIFALRLAFGLLMLERLRRRSLAPLPAPLVARFDAIRRELGIQRLVTFCECSLVAVPAVIGFVRPVVLLPVRALTGLSPAQLEAVIAHELGHVRRFDVIANLFQVVTETLFFFHPAVWWLNRRVRADREDCCDDIAVSVAGNKLGLARALIDMEAWRALPTLALAATGSPVASRVARLLGVNHSPRDNSAAGMVTTTLVLAMALVAGAASIALAQPAEASDSAADAAEIAALAAAEPVPAIAAREPVAPPELDVVVAPAVAPAAVVAPAPVVSPAPVVAPAPVIAPAPVAAPKPLATPTPVAPPPPAPVSGSFVEDMKLAGFEDLDVDTLIALKVHGVTSAYVTQLGKLDFDTNVEDVIAFKVHDVNPEFVREIRALGFQPDADQIVALKVHDVTADFVKNMRGLDLEFDTDELIALKVHDVTPEYVRRMRANGLDANTEELVAMKVHDVTPEYRKALEAAGFKPDAEQLIEAKVMDLTPEFLERVRKHGFKNLSLEQLIHLKHADVL